jgi:nucleoside 2-deoxyribosyltransferase
MKTKLYLAGPLFTTGERMFNAALAALLRGKGYEVFLPQENEQKPPVTAAGIFTADVEGFEWAHVIVGNMDGPDPDSGTCFECGAVFRRKPVILYRTDFRDINDGFPPFNLMLTQSAAKVIDAKWMTVEQVADRIDEALISISRT